MIEKLNYGWQAGGGYVEPTREVMCDKINELVDAVNTIQKEREAERFEIQEWIGILEAVRKSVNVHEKQIDELQMKVEPEKCETRSENVQSDAKTRSENVQDPTKWLGKLCKFWDGDEQMSHLCWGILYTITPTSPVPFCCSLGDGVTSDYEHCEPVLPTDNAIYKGGDNDSPAN